MLHWLSVRPVGEKAERRLWIVSMTVSTTPPPDPESISANQFKASQPIDHPNLVTKTQVGQLNTIWDTQGGYFSHPNWDHPKLVTRIRTTPKLVTLTQFIQTKKTPQEGHPNWVTPTQVPYLKWVNPSCSKHSGQPKWVTQII